MTIEGDYSLFAHLETVYLGCLARRTLIMRNVREVVEAAHGKPILFFPARHDHWLVQTGDGWAAHVAGAIGVSTDAQASWWGGRGVGTVPHGLIAAFGGDTVAAARGLRRPLRRRDERDRAGRLRERLGAHRARGGRGARRPALGRAARHLGADGRPGAVAARWASSSRPASTPSWSRRVREALDEAGPPARPDRRLGRVRRRQDPRSSRQLGAPVDAYGVGSSLVRGAERLHRGRGAAGGRARRQGGPPLQPEPAAGARGRRTQPLAQLSDWVNR